MRYLAFTFLWVSLLFISATTALAQEVVLVPTDNTSLYRQELPLNLQDNVTGRIGTSLIVESNAAVKSSSEWNVIYPAPAKALAEEPSWFGQYDMQDLHVDWISTAGFTGQGTVVAVVDTGVRADHPDSPSSILPGWNFLDADNDPMTANTDAQNRDTTDGHGHGTGVAGIIASPINGVGMRGMSPSVSILPVKVLNSGGNGTTLTVSEGIRWAADNGAHIINVSIGANSDPGDLLQLAINYARSKNAVVVCATGNGGGSQVAFPARISECLSVGSHDLEKQRDSFSQYGPGLDLMANGHDVLMPNKRYGNPGYYLLSSGTGTSFAAPHVAAAAALLRQQGTYTTPGAIEDRLIQTANDLGPAGWDNETGWGALNAASALNVTEPVAENTGDSDNGGSGNGVQVPQTPAPDTTSAPQPDVLPTCISSSATVASGQKTPLNIGCGSVAWKILSVSNGSISGNIYSAPAKWTGRVNISYAPQTHLGRVATIAIVVTKVQPKLALTTKMTRSCIQTKISKTVMTESATTQVVLQYKVGKKWVIKQTAKKSLSNKAWDLCLKKPIQKGQYRVVASINATSYNLAASAMKSVRL